MINVSIWTLFTDIQVGKRVHCRPRTLWSNYRSWNLLESPQERTWKQLPAAPISRVVGQRITLIGSPLPLNLKGQQLSDMIIIKSNYFKQLNHRGVQLWFHMVAVEERGQNRRQK